MIHGIHLALLCLATLTIVSTIVFARLRAQDVHQSAGIKPRFQPVCSVVLPDGRVMTYTLVSLLQLQ